MPLAIRAPDPPPATDNERRKQLDRPELRRILVVDDELDIQTVVREVLEGFGGYDVEAQSSGEQALRVAPGFAPDLILLDVMMPGMDGPTTLRALRACAETATTPVVLLTARAQPQEIEEYRRLGAADVIVKPFDPMQLCSRVREIWNRQPRSTAPGEQTG